MIIYFISNCMKKKHFANFKKLHTRGNLFSYRISRKCCATFYIKHVYEIFRNCLNIFNYLPFDTFHKRNGTYKCTFTATGYLIAIVILKVLRGIQRMIWIQKGIHHLKNFKSYIYIIYPNYQIGQFKWNKKALQKCLEPSWK